MTNKTKEVIAIIAVILIIVVALVVTGFVLAGRSLHPQSVPAPISSEE